MNALAAYLQRRDLQRTQIATTADKPSKRVLPSAPPSSSPDASRVRSTTTSRIQSASQDLVRQDAGRNDAAVDDSRRLLDERMGMFHLSSQRISEYVMEPELASVETVCRHFATVILPQVFFLVEILCGGRRSGEGRDISSMNGGFADVISDAPTNRSLSGTHRQSLRALPPSQDCTHLPPSLPLLLSYLLFLFLSQKCSFYSSIISLLSRLAVGECFHESIQHL
jgi:hypothetical protein